MNNILCKIIFVCANSVSLYTTITQYRIQSLFSLNEHAKTTIAFHKCPTSSQTT